MSQEPEEFRRDVESRQRNIVFPDTVRNEVRFWRSLRSGRLKLGGLQLVGLALISIIPVAILWDDAAMRFRYATSGSLVNRVEAAFGYWVILFSFFGALFLLLRWGTLRTLQSASRRKGMRPPNG